MARRKQPDPLPDDIAKMTSEECKAEEKRMIDSLEFEHAIEERDRWQAVADAWITRKGYILSRQVGIIRAKNQEED